MDAWLVAVHRGPTGQRWQLPATGRVVIGRVSDAEVKLDDAFVGRRHAGIDRHATGDTFCFWGTSSGSSVDDVECDMIDIPLRDGAELRIGSVYLRYLCGPDAAVRAARATEQIAVIDTLTGFPLGEPAGAARLALRDIAALRARYGLVRVDQLVRRIARRLATLAAGDAAIHWTRDDCFAIDPPEVARRLVVEASLEPIDCAGQRLEVELDIE